MYVSIYVYFMEKVFSFGGVWEITDYGEAE